ncbi:MAG: hypothetical protein GY696_00815 [Gammaproteobacteria bacterium]|nr:hypothetical protein [Gammaproteobacteria bacterium]
MQKSKKLGTKVQNILGRSKSEEAIGKKKKKRRILKRVAKIASRDKVWPSISAPKMPAEEPEDILETTAKPIDFNDNYEMEIESGARTTSVPRSIVGTDQAIYEEMRSIFNQAALKGDTLNDWMAKMERQGIMGLENEFLMLKRNMAIHPADAFRANPTKNRYNGKTMSFCIPETRVRSKHYTEIS